MSDTIELYMQGDASPFLSMSSSFAPIDGDLINIRKVTYLVIGRSFSIDYADKPAERRIRCNVILKIEQQ